MSLESKRVAYCTSCHRTNAGKVPERGPWNPQDRVCNFCDNPTLVAVPDTTTAEVTV